MTKTPPHVRSARPQKHPLWGVADAARAIARGDLTPETLLELCVSQIEATEHAVRAWEIVVSDSARRVARQQTENIGESSRNKLLYGIPFAAKDNYFTRGIPTTGSSERYRHFVPTFTARALEQLTAQGAILLGKTTTTEMALGDPPPTRNPWNLDHTPGGSSAGSAAAVAAGYVPFAMASQTGGSINRPASYCGLYALKPTYGKIPRHGVFPLAWSLDHLGAMTRSLEDQCWVLDAFWGTAFRHEVVHDPSFVRGLRIARPDRYFVGQAVAPAQWMAYEKTLAAYQAAGAQIVDMTLPPSFEDALHAHHIIMEFELARAHAPSKAEDWDKMRPLLQQRIRSGLSYSSVEYLRAMARRRSFVRALDGCFDAFDILATPTTPTLADVGIEDSGSSAFNTAFSLAGFPTLVFPTGVETTQNLPLSMQWIARPHQEALLLRACGAIDRPWCEG